MKDTVPVNRFVCTSVVALYLYMLSFYSCSPLYTSIKKSDNNNNLYYVFLIPITSSTLFMFLLHIVAHIV
jgi:hypothetical protein